VRFFVVAGSPAAQQPHGLAPGPEDRVIAADFGARHALRWGWRVDLLVGDLDSLPADTARGLEASGVEVLRARAAKDETDTELAVARALEMGAEQIVICGATGGRTDHLLANVFLLSRAPLASVDACLVDGGETIRLLRADGEFARPKARAQGRKDATQPPDAGGELGRLTIEGAAGDLLSLLPLGADAAGVSTGGLLYPLEDETLHLGEARGISNVLTGSRAEVSLRRGRLLVIHNRMETK